MGRRKQLTLEQLNSQLAAPVSIDLEEFSEVDTKLDYRERIFVERFCMHGIAKQACAEAGYAPKGSNGRERVILSRPKIQLAILKRYNAIQKASCIQKQTVLIELSNIIEELKAEEKPNITMQLKVWDMIARVAGLYQPEMQVNIQNNIDAIKIEIVTSPKPAGNGAQD